MHAEEKKTETLALKTSALKEKWEPEKIRAAVEAMLFISGSVVSLTKMYQAFREAHIQVSKKKLEKEIRQLMEHYQNTTAGLLVEEVAGGFRLITRPEFHKVLLKFQEEKRRQRISSAAVETLAVIAYKQPITRTEIESIRGVSVSAILKKLVELGLIQVIGRSQKKKTKGAYLYGTTEKFLESFGLKSLEDLPEIAY
ncbi:MAG: SMC-Scp complex subunit ScpB [Planctomycetota bacterium]|nr:MAG: SMC-Scp complex subunit ScpB [Planctomycetota bacterium]